MVNLTTRPLYPREKNLGTLGMGGQVDPRTCLYLWKRKEKSLVPTGIRAPDRPARSLVAIPTTLLRLLYVQFHVHVAKKKNNLVILWEREKGR